MSILLSLQTNIPNAMRADQHRLRQQLRALQRAQKQGQPSDRNLERLSGQLQRSIALRQARQAGAPAVRFDQDLPINARREEIARAIAEHPVVVVCGETGSGKSTQLPKICLDLGRGIGGLIGHTQPRRIAARSVAARLAEELGSPLGRHVGFKIRFTDTTRPETTYVKLMTDGILLAETQHSRFLDHYDTIILDEAHERSLNIDFLIGYLRRLLPRRPDLRLIITSATIDAERFSEFFSSEQGPAPVIEVSGRTYPVEVRYRPAEPDAEGNEADLQQSILQGIEEVAGVGRGDILVFLPTERDIRETAKTLRGRALPGDHGRQTEILPLYARLSAADQNRVFRPHPHRRIVLATNVAESSLTVPGIRYVVDTGTARISRYSPRSKVQRLPIEPVSRASADQRQGRCGRLGPGTCIRLYSEQDYLGRDRFTTPEIRRTNLAAVILQTKVLDLGPIEQFPLLDPPRPDAIRDGYKTLFELGALDAQNELTGLGRRLSRLPVDPRIGRMILAADQENCLHEVLIIASALEMQDPRERPVDKQQAADQCHEQFADGASDFFSYLKLWDFYQRLKAELSRNQLRRACQQNFLSYNRMREWLDIHRQLLQLVSESGLQQHARRDQYEAVHRALLTGLLSNVAYRSDNVEYTGTGGTRFLLWPGSGTMGNKPKWIMAAELVETSRRYLRTVARIDPAWVEPLAGHLVKRSYSEPHWDRRSASVLAYEKVSLFGLPIVPRRRAPYGPVDPDACRELFIQHALVEGDLDRQPEFLEHNRRLLEQVQSLGAKSRRMDFLVHDRTRFDFYASRIPQDVCDGAGFNKWRKAAERKTPRLLYMTEEDLVEGPVEPVQAADFPDRLALDQMELPLEYRYEPGSAQDGITLIAPQEGLGRLDPGHLEWLVPGLLEEKLLALIRSLPKSIRRNLVPAGDTARKVAAELHFGQGTLLAAVAGALSRIGGERVSPQAFQLEKLPEHLRLNIRVVDAQGRPLAAGRDLDQLRQQFGVQQQARVDAVLDDGEWTRDGIVTWDFGPLPERIELRRGNLTLPAWPALVPADDSVALRLMDSPEKAGHQTRSGLRKLFYLAERRDLKAQVAWLPKLDQMTLYAASICGAQAFQQQLAELLADRAFVAGRPLPRSEAEFQQRRRAGRAQIGPAVQELTPLVTALMPAYHQARLGLEQAGTGPWQYALDDLRDQLARLAQPGFLTDTPWPWLMHLPRYFAAAAHRLEKLSNAGLARDQQAFAQLAPRQQAYLDRLAEHRQQGLHDPELERYGWMLEEFRVSLFAQQLGTSLPVSAKRLDKQWAAVENVPLT